MSSLSRIPHEDFNKEALEARSIVVLSDTYPPFTVGGAEISLSVCINSLPETERHKIVVITHDPDQLTLTSRYSNGVMVVRMPSSADFPFENLSVPQLHAHPLRRLLGVKNHTRSQIARRVLKFRDRSNVLLARKEARSHPTGGILRDHLTSPKDFNGKAYIELIKMMKNFEILVADNTRSILLGAKILDVLTPSQKSVGIVRDNRFHCPRPSQSANIGGKMCQTPCQFECAVKDAPRAPHLRHKSLGLTYAHRQKSLNAFSKVITTSHQLIRHLLPVVAEKTKLLRIPNGFGDLEEIDKFTFGRAQFHKDKLLIIGMLNENKGQIQFLKKASRWIKENPNIEIILCGRGDRIASAIKSFSQKNGISKQVRLLGFRSQDIIYDEIRKAKIILAPTVWPEPFGRVPLEAGIANRAIVSFAVGGLNESIVDGKTGFLVKPGDYDAFIGKVQWLLDNPAKRLEMEKNARRHIMNGYGFDQTAEPFAKAVF